MESRPVVMLARSHRDSWQSRIFLIRQAFRGHRPMLDAMIRARHVGEPGRGKLPRPGTLRWADYRRAAGSIDRTAWVAYLES